MVANIEEVLQRGEALSGKSAASACGWFTPPRSSRPFVSINPFNTPRFCLLQLSTPRPATCPACQRSTGATPSTWTPAPPTLNWQLEVSFSSCSLSTFASGGSKGAEEEEGGGGGVEGGGVHEEIEQQIFDLLRKKKRKSLLSVRLLQTNHRPLCPCWSSDVLSKYQMMPFYIVLSSIVLHSSL